MKNTAPISQGAMAVAALFGFVSAGVAIILFNFGLFAGLFIGLLVAVIVAIVIALGMVPPETKPDSAPGQVAAPATEPVTQAQASKPPAAAATASPEPASAPEVEKSDKPAFLTAAREGGPDDLKLIKGVGPKLEKTLHGMGIYHFDQIAAWGPKEQAWVDDNLTGFKGRASRDNWVEQAGTLAAGGQTEFSKKAT